MSSDRHTAPLRTAIVGCGGISNTHAQAIAANPDAATLIACADIVRANAEQMAGKHRPGAAIYGDHRQMIEHERPELLIICTWPNLHEQIVLDAIERGVGAIICEKSLAMSAASAARMAAAANGAGCVLVEGYMYRHLPRTLELQRLVREGKIGPLRKIRAGFQRRALEGTRSGKKHELGYGGVTFDFTCYCVSGVGAFTGELPERVWAEWQRRDDGLVIELHGMLRYANGLLAIIESSYTYGYHQPLELHGEAGILRIHDAWVGGGDNGIEWDINERPTSVELIATPVAKRHHEQLLHVCHCIRTGERPRMTLGESVRNHAIIDAMLQSAQTGQPVQPEMPHDHELDEPVDIRA